MKVNILKRNDPSFPKVLRDIPSAPKELYYEGASPKAWVDKPRVAIIGSRKLTAYGRQVTEQFAKGLAEHGVVIISGLALGVDAVAHRAALEAGGLSVAVLPTNLDRIYPSSHTNLANQIIKTGGSLLSEYAPGSTTQKYQFTARNRIVSGLSDIVLITEAAAASGTMNTARFALEQGRTVMAVPGNITSPTSEGTNNLIKIGAGAATKIEDVLFELGIDSESSIKRVFSGTSEEELLLDMIRSGISSQEELALKMEMDGAKISSLLTVLEIKGFIKPAGGGFWLAI